MSKTTVDEMMKNLTAEQQQQVNEIMRRESRQTKVDAIVQATQICMEASTQTKVDKLVQQELAAQT